MARSKYSQPYQKPTYKIYTKLQLIKKLKADGNFTYDFVNELDTYSQYIYNRGSYDDIYQTHYTDRGRETAEAKIYKLLDEVKEEFPEPALARNRVYQTESVVQSADYNVESNEMDACRAVLYALLTQMTTKEIENFEFDTFNFETSAEEYISISVGASVWSYYVKGSVTVLGKEYTAKGVSYRSSDARRL